MTKGFQSGNTLGKGRPSGAKNLITREILDNFLYILQTNNTTDKIESDKE